MANSEDAHFVPRNHESVQGNVTRLSIGNYQLAQLALDASAHQRMRRKIVDRGVDCLHGTDSRMRVLVTQETERTLDVIERSRRIDYLRHGLGRGADASAASRPIQA